MHMYDFSTDTARASDYYIWFRSFPVITRGKQKVTSVEIPGRCGTLTQREETWSDTTVTMAVDITIPVFEKHSVDEIYCQFRERILRSTELYLEELHSGFFRVKNVEERSYSKESDITISLNLTFTCDPAEYVGSGKYVHDINDVLWNPYSACCPVYQIFGSGACTLTVNGKSMTANVEQNLAIDTELMLAYREDGTLKNAEVTGNYRDLYLQEGENEITVTSGFEMKVIPNWRRL